MNAHEMTHQVISRRLLLGGLGLGGLIVAGGWPHRAAALDHGGGGLRSDPWLSTNPLDGRLYLTWVGPDETAATHTDSAASPAAAESDHAAVANRVYIARSDDQGASFGEPVLVSGDDAYVSLGATPAVTGFGPDGAIYVAYLSATPHELSEWGREIVMVARSDDGASFAPAIEVPADEGITNAGGYHDLIVDGEGRVYVAYLDFRDTFNLGTGDFSTASLRVAWSDDRAMSFGPSVEVSAPACPCCPPRFYLDESGRLFLGWRDQQPQDDGTDPARDPMTAWSDDRGASWSAPVLVHRDDWQTPQCPHSGPGFGVDGGGRQHIAWYTGAEGRLGVYYAVADDADGPFAEPLALLHDEWVPVTPTRLVLDGDGNAFVAFVDGRNDPARIVITKITPAGDVSTVSPEDLAGTYPSLALTGAELGVAFVAGDDISTDTLPLGEAGG